MSYVIFKGENDMKKNEIEKENQECSNCKFYSGDRHGICRRYPPKIIGFDSMDNQNSEFPVVDQDDWCGEWEMDE